jgi:hypothetical protein
MDWHGCLSLKLRIVGCDVWTGHVERLGCYPTLLPTAVPEMNIGRWQQQQQIMDKSLPPLPTFFLVSPRQCLFPTEFVLASPTTSDGGKRVIAQPISDVAVRWNARVIVASLSKAIDDDSHRAEDYYETTWLEGVACSCTFRRQRLACSRGGRPRFGGQTGNGTSRGHAGEGSEYEGTQSTIPGLYCSIRSSSVRQSFLTWIGAMICRTMCICDSL